MKNKIISGLILILFFSLFSCQKDPTPRTIKGTIIDTTTNSTIKYDTITIDRIYNYKLGRLAKDFIATTDNKGFFSCSIYAKRGDVMTIYLDKFGGPISIHDTPIYQFTITKDKEYNLGVIKTQKP